MEHTSVIMISWWYLWYRMMVHYNMFDTRILPVTYTVHGNTESWQCKGVHVHTYVKTTSHTNSCIDYRSVSVCRIQTPCVNANYIMDTFLLTPVLNTREILRMRGLTVDSPPLSSWPLCISVERAKLQLTFIQNVFSSYIMYDTSVRMYAILTMLTNQSTWRQSTCIYAIVTASTNQSRWRQWTSSSLW